MKKKIDDFLRSSGNYTKVDISYFTRGTFWLSSAQIVNSLAVFGLSIILTKFLPREVFGKYKYILSLGSILAGFVFSGYYTAITQSVARGEEGLLKEGFWRTLRKSWLALILSCTIGTYYLIKNDITIGVSIIVIGILNPLSNAFQLAFAFLYGKKEFKKISLYTSLTTIANLIILFSTLFLTKNVIAIVCINTLSNSILGCFIYLYTIYHFHPNQNFTDKSVRYGEHLGYINIISIIGANIDSLLLFHYLGSANLALYSIATAIPDQTKSFFRSIPDLMFIKYAESNANIEKNKIVLLKKMFFLVVLIVFGITMYVLVSPSFFDAFFPHYHDAIKYTQLYSLTILGLIGMIPQALLQSQQKTKELYAINNYYLLFQIISVVVGIMSFGFMGVVIARILTRAFFLFISTYFFLKAYN
jgi:O-antigen/teichoic acid export membrane protein